MDSLTKRRDNRSTEIFSSNIKDFNKKHQIYAESLKLDLIDKLSRNDISYVDTGYNTGELIKNKLPYDCYDYLFTVGSKQLKVEICTAPPYLKAFFTFKLHKIERVIAENELLLVTQFDNYFSFKLEAVKWMHQHLTHGIYEKFSPNDLAVRLFTDDRLMLGDLVSKHDWSLKAKGFMKKHKDILLKKKER